MAWRGSDCLCDAASCATPRGHASYLAWPMRSQMRSTRLAEQVHRREWHVRKRRSLAFATSSCVGSCYRERKASSSIRLVKTIQIGVRNVMVFSRKSLLEPVQSANFSRGLRPPRPRQSFSRLSVESQIRLYFTAQTAVHLRNRTSPRPTLRRLLGLSATTHRRGTARAMTTLLTPTLPSLAAFVPRSHSLGGVGDPVALGFDSAPSL